MVSVPESPPQVLSKTTLVQLIALTYIKCYALAMFNWPEVVVFRVSKHTTRKTYLAISWVCSHTVTVVSSQRKT